MDRTEQAEKLLEAMAMTNKVKTIIDDISQEKTENLTFEQFEKLYSSVQDMLKATWYISKISTMVEYIPEDLYVKCVMLHNNAVDFMESYEKYKKENGGK